MPYKDIDARRRVSRENNSRRRDEHRRLGLCIECGEPSPEHLRCEGCRAFYAAQARSRRSKSS